MEKFFKIGDIVVDVDGDSILDGTSGKRIKMYLDNCCFSSFNHSTKKTPLRIEGTDIFTWDVRNSGWKNFNDCFHPDVVKAVKKYIQIKTDMELLD